MLQISEAEALGRFDKAADYVSSYILDRLITQNACTRGVADMTIEKNTVLLDGMKIVIALVSVFQPYDFAGRITETFIHERK